MRPRSTRASPSAAPEASAVRDRARKRSGIAVDIPGARKLHLDHLVCDFNGTLATDGKLIAGVAARLRRLARAVDIVVMTADTFGTARSALRALPATVRTVHTGTDKRRLVDELGGGVVAVGNGRNDVPMFRSATLAIAVVGTEGAVPRLMTAAAVVVRDINDALDLLIEPMRLVATLRR